MADEQKPTTSTSTTEPIVENGNTAAPAPVPAEEEELTAQQFLDEADRFMALKQWMQAFDGYAQALELLQEEHGQDAPALAPVLHRYGKCLLEHAISTSGALGGGGSKEPPQPKQKSQSSKASGSSSKQAPADPRFHFSGDADDDDEEEEEEQEGAAAEDDDDDLSVAFHTLDFTRVIYQKVLHGGKAEADAPEDPEATLETLAGERWGVVRIKNQLAEVLNDLGDVGLESENFQQASSDYEACLHLLSPLLHPHSRRLADAYLRLGLALEFHPDISKQQTARQYIESATNTLKSRLEAVETRRGIQAQSGAAEERTQTSAAQAREEKVVEDSKGKGKSREEPVETDDVARMDSVKLDSEAKDLQEIISELELKLQDLSVNSNATASSSSTAALPQDAKAALQQAINDAFLGGSTNAAPAAFGAPSSSSSSAPVNDLSSMVRKKKKRAPEEGEGVEESDSKGKGKSVEVASDAKKARVE